MKEIDWAQLTPPRELIDLVGGEFHETAKEFFRYMVDLCTLQPQHSMLEVGCGCGRMAAPLTGYLDEKGSYYGFDIHAETITWCHTAYDKIRCPNFHFTLANIVNKVYNPTGEIPAKSFIFPYEDEFFDRVMLTSVFTHMLPDDVEHYFSEISRVVRPGGMTLITFFLLNAESRALISENRSTIPFTSSFHRCMVTNLNVPEAVIAYDEQDVLALFSKNGLLIQEPIHYGSWCGRSNYLSLQDIIIAQKIHGTPVPE